MTRLITVMMIMAMMNASSPDPSGHSHTDMCFYIVHSHLGLAQQVVYLVPAGFTTCWPSRQFSLISIVSHLESVVEGQPNMAVADEIVNDAGGGRPDDAISVNKP